MEHDLLGRVYDVVAGWSAGLDDHGLAAPTRTAWTVVELVVHLHLDAQRTLVALASPAAPEDTPDVDAVTYWDDWSPSDVPPDEDPHVRFVRVATSAYSRPAVAVSHFAETAAAAGRASSAALRERPTGLVRTQGHVIGVTDLVSTLVVEAAIHLLDLTAHVPGPAVPAAALAEVRRVLDARLGTRESEVGSGWTDEEYALTATGRAPLGAADRARLGTLASRIPLLG